ncbi:hypothetical protein EU510_11140 [Pseudoalteromonas sp. FUC4]|uniref:hypothetical protein n=1 Tax=Pseudoalteromonas sp. FUC4 TaxID=2511201 RepID=UPI0011F31912|nr:hypothetical protein [Pseudoalteromonas sp. FUC4]KAA1152607.1 hypothetical protein EU510_11140 [Pseudoalteromonas sp. FUC4]
MEVVIYSEDNTPEVEPSENYYRATRLEDLPEIQFQKVRHHIFCPGCFSQAAFVSRGKDGRAPHFKSVHRQVNGKDCDRKSADTIHIDPNTYKSVNELKNDDNIFVVDFNFGASEQVVKPAKSSKDVEKLYRKKPGTYRKFGEANQIGKSEWSRRLSTILRTLCESDDFVKSNDKIKVMGYVKPINKAFYHAKRVVKYLKPKSIPAFFYGMIVSTKVMHDGAIWLNIGDNKNELSIMIPKTVLESLKSRHPQLEENENTYPLLHGASFLVYGYYNSSKNNKPYIGLYEKASEFIAFKFE